MNPRYKTQSFIDRIMILFGKKINSNLAMESMHKTMLIEGFYSNFRDKVDIICENLRLAHEGSKSINIFSQITSKHIHLGAQQKLILRTIHSLNFNKAMVYSKAFGTTIWFPIDRYWQDELRVLGLRFNRPICLILMSLFRSISSLKSFLEFIQLSFVALKISIYPQPKPWLNKVDLDRVLLFGFNEGNFPNSKHSSHNLFDWLTAKIGTDKVYIHNCPSKSLRSSERSNLYFQETLISGASLNDILVSFLKLPFILIRYLLNPNLKVSDLTSQLDELLPILFFSKQSNRRIYDFVFFPSTMLIARPLWSIFLEISGSKVVLVNYTAMAAPLGPNLTRVVDGIWHLSAWTDTWVVDEYQATQMSLTSKYASKNYISVGVPYWSGQIYESSFNAEVRFIAVFDTHIRSNQVFTAGVVDEMGWNDTDLEEIFISIVLEIASQLNLVVLHKKKRKVPGMDSTRVDEITDRLKSKYGSIYQPIDEDFSALSLIQLAVAVISKPISTTAFVASEVNVPSIVLDPTKNVRMNDPGLRNCKLAYSNDELLKILESIIKK